MYLFLVFIMEYVFLKIFHKFSILDKPRVYGFSRKPVPYSFGIVLYLLFLLGAFLYNVSFVDYWFLFLGSGIIVVTAFFDDLYKINPLIRLFIQFLVAFLVVYNGVNIDVITNPFNFEIINLSSVSFLISVLWIVFLTNVMNFLDGVEGVSSGVSSVAFFTIASLTLIPNLHVVDQLDLTILSLLMVVLSFSAFLLEFPKPFPKVLVGDSGTMFYGFLLACFSMLSGGKLFTLLIVLLVPILDALFVIFYRIFNKKLPFIGDRNHFHHKLLALNFSR